MIVRPAQFVRVVGDSNRRAGAVAIPRMGLGRLLD